MPYINIKITREGVTAEQKAELIKGATELLARVLNKNPKTTFALKFIFHYTLSKRSQKTSAYRHQYPLTSGICLLSFLF